MQMGKKHNLFSARNSGAVRRFFRLNVQMGFVGIYDWIVNE